MKRLCLIPLIAILTACVSSPELATPTPKIEMATIMSVTKTPVPTNTIVPTPTKDPSIPEGYIKDVSGNYTTDIDGITITWDKERNAGYSLMFDDHLLDRSPSLEDGLRDTLRLKVFIDPKIANWNKLSVTHADNKNVSGGPVDANDIVQNFLWDAMIWRGLMSHKTEFSVDKWYNTGGYTIQYTTLEGPQTLILKHGNVTTVHIRADYEALKADTENNKFTEAKGDELLGNPNIKYMIKISSDKDGNTYAEIAPNIMDALEWSDKRIIEMFLYGFANALSNQDDPLIPRPMSFGSEVAYNNKAYPYFMITRQE